MLCVATSFDTILLSVIQVSFTTPIVRVNENVQSGSTQVCLIADSASARPYTVVVGRRPSGSNPATRKFIAESSQHNVHFLPTASEDYTINNADLTVTFPAGEPMEQCIPVGIVDDEVALEGEETFQFFFVTLPEGVVAGDPDEAVVTIVDDDDGKRFTSGPVARKKAIYKHGDLAI